MLLLAIGHVAHNHGACYCRDVNEISSDGSLGVGCVQSAALGMALAGATALGYCNMYVTAPSPENLTTLFKFAVRGLEALGYREHTGMPLLHHLFELDELQIFVRRALAPCSAGQQA